MSEPVYQIEVITPQGIAFQGNVAHCEIRDENGYVGILAGHAPLITASPGGRMTLRLEDGAEKKFQTGSGLFEIVQNRAIFLSQTFEALA